MWFNILKTGNAATQAMYSKIFVEDGEMAKHLLSIALDPDSPEYPHPNEKNITPEQTEMWLAKNLHNILNSPHMGLTYQLMLEEFTQTHALADVEWDKIAADFEELLDMVHWDWYEYTYGDE